MVEGEAEGGQARDGGEEAMREAAAGMVALLVLRRDGEPPPSLHLDVCEVPPSPLTLTSVSL